jgi:hypothetical protein
MVVVNGAAMNKLIQTRRPDRRAELYALVRCARHARIISGATESVVNVLDIALDALELLLDGATFDEVADAVRQRAAKIVRTP